MTMCYRGRNAIYVTMCYKGRNVIYVTMCLACVGTNVLPCSHFLCIFNFIIFCTVGI